MREVLLDPGFLPHDADAIGGKHQRKRQDWLVEPLRLGKVAKHQNHQITDKDSQWQYIPAPLTRIEQYG